MYIINTVDVMACVQNCSVKLAHFLVILIAIAQYKSRERTNGLWKVQSDVGDFHVAQELCKPVTFHPKVNKSKPTPLVPLSPEIKFRRVICLVQELILVNALLQCNDISLNPGPVRKTCAGCFKIFKRNQAGVSCIECLSDYHLKCAGAAFENNKTCRLCFVPQADPTYQHFADTKSDLVNSLENVVKCRGLKCVHQNIRSLLYKIDEVRQIMCDLKNGLTESWLNSSIKDEEIGISGYNIFRKDRSSKGGGVVVFVREDLPIVRRTDLEQCDIESIWLEVTMPRSRGFLVGSYYRPPSSSKHNNSDFMNALSDTIEILATESKEVILIGDFNCDFSAVRSSQSECKQLKCLFKTLNYTQIINSPTRITPESSTLIDLIATNNPQNLSTSGVLSSSLSDHELTFCVRKLNWMRFPAEIKTFRNYANYNQEDFCAELFNVNWDDVLQPNDSTGNADTEAAVNDLWTNFKDCFCSTGCIKKK